MLAITCKSHFKRNSYKYAIFVQFKHLSINLIKKVRHFAKQSLFIHLIQFNFSNIRQIFEYRP